MRSLIVVLVIVSAVAAETTYCNPGSIFKIDCNKCTCSRDGKIAACTDMVCPKKITAKTICEPRSQFRDYCNTCFCAYDGSSFSCTRMMCDKEIWNKNGTLKELPASKKITKFASNQVCEPLSKFKSYCNTCFCAEDGSSFSCTRMMCDKEIWNENGTPKRFIQFKKSTKLETKRVCEPVSKFKDYCNTCFCANDGLSFSCTRMMCDKNIWNKDGSLKVVSKPSKLIQSDIGQVCKPRSQFKDYCNTCACADNGLSFVCTKMMCDEKIWNKDGSLKVALSTLNKSEKVCESGKAYSPDGCNTCICSKDGTKSACTFKLCLSTFKKSFINEVTEKWGPLYKQGDVCTPGKTFYSECNQCVCTDTGNSAICTLMTCKIRKA